MPFARGDYVRIKHLVPVEGDEEMGLTALRMVGLTGYVTSVDEWEEGVVVVDIDEFPDWLLAFCPDELEAATPPTV